MVSREGAHQTWAEAFALGKNYWTNGDTKNAIVELRKAKYLIKSFKEINDEDKRNFANNLTLLGMALFTEYQQEGIIDSLLATHNIYEINDCFNDSIKFIKELTPAERKPEDQYLFAYNFQLLAELYAYDNDDVKLINKCDTALKEWALCEETSGRHRNMALLAMLKAQIYQNQRKFSDAKTCYAFALKQLAEIKEEDPRLKNKDLRVAAACYHQGALIAKATDELIHARRLLMEEIKLLGKLTSYESEDMENISSAYDQLSKLGIYSSETALYQFAKNIFSPGFFSFFHQPSYHDLSNFFYHVQEISMDKTSYLTSLSNLVSLICHTCRMEAFPEISLKRFLHDDKNLQKLEEKLSGLKLIDSDAAKLLQLKERLIQVEKENAELKIKVDEVSKELEAIKSAKVVAIKMENPEIKSEPAPDPVKEEPAANVHTLKSSRFFPSHNTRSRSKQFAVEENPLQKRL